MMQPMEPVRPEPLRERNRAFYESLWSAVRLVEAERFNTWPLVRGMVAASKRRLEVAPGLRPRLPIRASHFVDLSLEATRELAARGGDALCACASALPYPDASFDLVAAFDILEHLEDDRAVTAELARITVPGGRLLLSTPLHPQRWTPFDDLVGHCRRYRPAELTRLLEGCGLAVEQSAVYGMQPRSGRWLDLGMWYLQHQRERALWWYDRVILPLATRFQSPLELRPGLIPTDGVDEILLVCRRQA